MLDRFGVFEIGPEFLISVQTGYFSGFPAPCCGYPFELHQLVDAIQMSTHNICFIKKIRIKNKTSHKIH